MAKWSLVLMDAEERETEWMVDEYVSVSAETPSMEQHEPDNQDENMWQMKIAVHEGWRLLRMHARHLSVVAYWQSLVSECRPASAHGCENEPVV